MTTPTPTTEAGKLATPRTDLQLQKQAEEAFYGNATLNSTNAVDLGFARLLERELVALQSRAENAERERDEAVAKYRAVLHSDEVSLLMAREDGWREDTSPETEMSKINYWWNDGLLKRLAEDSLVDLYCDKPVDSYITMIGADLAAARAEVERLKVFFMDGRVNWDALNSVLARANKLAEEQRTENIALRAEVAQLKERNKTLSDWVDERVAGRDLLTRQQNERLTALQTKADALAGALENAAGDLADAGYNAESQEAAKVVAAYRSSTPAPAPAPDKLKKETNL